MNINYTSVVCQSSNILSNGVFDDATNWSVTGGVTIGSGKASFDNITSGYLYQTAVNMVTNLVANTVYILTFVVSGTSNNGLFFKIQSDSTLVDYLPFDEYNNGTKTVIFKTPADIDGGGFRIYFFNVGDSGGSIDDLVLIPTTSLIANGDFANGSKWTANTAWTIGSGVVTYDDVTNNAMLVQEEVDMVSAIEINTDYIIAFNIVVTTPNASFSINDHDGNVGYVGLTGFTTGYQIIPFTTGGIKDGGGISFWGNTGSGSSFTIDNIILVKV